MPVSLQSSTPSSLRSITDYLKLIIITGYPCSGKTHRALQIANDFTTRIDSHNSSLPNAKRPLSIQQIPSHHTVSSREEIYTSANAEKTARASEFSAIKRGLNKDTVVIADSGNYIKGYRYQLWCEAKAAGTRCCVVHVAAREDEVEGWNRERSSGQEQVQQEDARAATTRVKGSQFVDKPESHTFIYGDRKDGHDEENAEDGLPDVLKARRKQQSQNGGLESDLKSLYLDLRVPDTADENKRPSEPIFSTPTQPPATLETIPSFPPPSPPYTPETLHSLISRYEPPSPFTRWDTPLFTIPSSDTHPPYTDIWTALFPQLASPPPPTTSSGLALPTDQTPSQSAPSITTARTSSTSFTRRRGFDDPAAPVRPHAATVLPAAANSNALQVLERSTQTVMRHILSFAQDNTLSGTVGDQDLEINIPLPNPPPPSKDANEEKEAATATLTVPAGTPLTLPVLQRLRRRYIQVQRVAVSRGAGGGGTAAARGDERAIMEGFCRWLGDEFAEGGTR